MTKKNTKETQAKKYKIIASNTPFTYFDTHETDVYPITFRVVRFPIAEGVYETIITNLSDSDFDAVEIKKMYHLRWGIETAFRELKYAVGLLNFHAKKVEFVIQEIYARIIMYNFCEMITIHVVIKRAVRKHHYQINSTVAIQICRYYYKSSQNIRAPNVEELSSKTYIASKRRTYSKSKIQ